MSDDRSRTPPRTVQRVPSTSDRYRVSDNTQSLDISTASKTFHIPTHTLTQPVPGLLNGHRCSRNEKGKRKSWGNLNGKRVIRHGAVYSIDLRHLALIAHPHRASGRRRGNTHAGNTRAEKDLRTCPGCDAVQWCNETTRRCSETSVPV